MDGRRRRAGYCSMDGRLRAVARSSRCGLEVRGNGRRRSGVENAKHTWAVVSGAFVIDDEMLDVFQEGGWRDFKDELPIGRDHRGAINVVDAPIAPNHGSVMEPLVQKHPKNRRAADRGEPTGEGCFHGSVYRWGAPRVVLQLNAMPIESPLS